MHVYVYVRSLQFGMLGAGRPFKGCSNKAGFFFSFTPF